MVPGSGFGIALQLGQLLAHFGQGALQFLRMLDQGLDGLCVGIVLFLHYCVSGKPRRLFGSFFNDPAGDPDYRRACRHFLYHNRVGSDSSTVADLETAEHLGTGANDDALSQGRMPLGPAVERGAAKGHALVDRAAVADLGGFADCAPHAVIDEHAAADLRTRMNLDAGQPASQLGSEAAEPAQAVNPEPVPELVDVERVQPGIASEHFPACTRSRVALQDACDIVAQLFEHERILRVSD